MVWSLKMSTKSYQKPQFGKICQNSNFTLDSLYQFCMQNWHTLLAGFLTDLIIAYSSVVKWVKVRVYAKMKIVFFFYLKKKSSFTALSTHVEKFPQFGGSYSNTILVSISLFESKSPFFVQCSKSKQSFTNCQS